MRTKYEIIEYVGNAVKPVYVCDTIIQADHEWRKNQNIYTSGKFRLFQRVYDERGQVAFERTVKGYNV